MNLRTILTVFVMVFLAELGDKTQLATFLYSTDSRNPRLAVFVGAAAALVLATAIAVLVGGLVSRHVNPKHLSWAAGIGFILIGVWTLARA